MPVNVFVRERWDESTSEHIHLYKDIQYKCTECGKEGVLYIYYDGEQGQAPFADERVISAPCEHIAKQINNRIVLNEVKIKQVTPHEIRFTDGHNVYITQGYESEAGRPASSFSENFMRCSCGGMFGHRIWSLHYYSRDWNIDLKCSHIKAVLKIKPIKLRLPNISSEMLNAIEKYITNKNIPLYKVNFVSVNDDILELDDGRSSGSKADYRATWEVILGEVEVLSEEKWRWVAGMAYGSGITSKIKLLPGTAVYCFSTAADGTNPKHIIYYREGGERYD